MENLLANRLKKIVLIFVISIIAISVICLILFRKKVDVISIDNFSDYYKTPADITENIQSALYSIVSSNLKDGTTVPTSGATIRSDAYTYDEAEKYGTFVVDLPDLQQSYFGQFQYSDSEDAISSTTIIFQCIRDKKLIIYSDFSCIDDFSYDSEYYESQDAYIDLVLPYIDTLDSGEEFILKRLLTDELYVYTDTCSKGSLIEARQKSLDYLELRNVKNVEVNYDINNC